MLSVVTCTLTAVAFADVVTGMHSDWELKQLPKVQLLAYKFWRQSRHPDTPQIWQGDAEHLQHHFLKLVHQVTLSHSDKASPAFKAVKKSCSSIAMTLENLQHLLFKLKVAALPEPPAKPAKHRAKLVPRYICTPQHSMTASTDDHSAQQIVAGCCTT